MTGSLGLAVLVFAIVALSSLFQASVGFGANLIAQPIVFQLDPDLVPGPVLMATAVLSVGVVTRERRPVPATSLGLAVAGAVVGTALGGIAIAAASERVLGLIIAGCVLAMVAITAARSGLGRSPTTLVAAGTFGGFGSTTAGIGGPPLALLFVDAGGSETRAFLSSYFLIASALTFTVLHLAGRFGADQLLAGLGLLPAALIGFVASGPLLPVVDRGATRPAILIVSAGAAVVLAIRTVLG